MICFNFIIYYLIFNRIRMLCTTAACTRHSIYFHLEGNRYCFCYSCCWWLSCLHYFLYGHVIHKMLCLYILKSTAFYSCICGRMHWCSISNGFNAINKLHSNGSDSGVIHYLHQNNVEMTLQPWVIHIAWSHWGDRNTCSTKKTKRNETKTLLLCIIYTSWNTTRNIDLQIDFWISW